MDPNLFHLDWERTFEALTAIIILSFIVERALAMIFENRMFIERFDRPGLKELIALVAAVALCVAWSFDAVSIIILAERTTVAGCIVTGAVVAGGSKASIKLFHDVLEVKSSAYEQRHVLRAAYAAREAETLAERASSDRVSPRERDVLERKALKQAERAKEAAASGGSAAADAAARAESAARKLQGQPDPDDAARKPDSAGGKQ